MKPLYMLISFIALIATVGPSVLYCMGSMDLNLVKWIMLLATIVWFIVTPLWVEKEKHQE
ncbi:MAG: hypothetical protein GC154_13150 [bacterium]|nr:hypothetical protein [bacterium]